MKKLAVLLAAVLFCAPAFAGNSGILKLSLWGDLAVAVPNNTKHVTGLELGIGSDTAKLSGVQFDFIYAKAGTVTGVQAALVAQNNNVTGVQWGFINFSEKLVKGAQLGFYNQAEELHGVQFGLVNNVKNIYGLQLGLVNIAKTAFSPSLCL